MEQHINMETQPSCSPTLSPAEQPLGRRFIFSSIFPSMPFTISSHAEFTVIIFVGNLIVAEKDMPFETLADFLIHKTRREVIFDTTRCLQLNIARALCLPVLIYRTCVKRCNIDQYQIKHHALS